MNQHLLLQDIIIRKLREHRAGAEWHQTCWSKKAGLTAEELHAGARILTLTRQMVNNRDPVCSEPLASERAQLLDPSPESQEKYGEQMRNRKGSVSGKSGKVRRRKTITQGEHSPPRGKMAEIGARSQMRNSSPGMSVLLE